MTFDVNVDELYISGDSLLYTILEINLLNSFIKYEVIFRYFH